MTPAFRNRLILIALALASRWLLEAAYAGAVAPIYGYGGYAYYPSASYTLLSYLAVLGFGLVVPLEGTPSKVLTVLFYLLFFIPLSVISPANDKPIEYYLLVCVSMAILIGIVRLTRVKPLKIEDFRLGRESFVVAAVGCIGLTVVGFLAQGGLALISFDITTVYDVRWEINEILTGPLGYLSDWSKNVFLPGLLSLALWRRNWLMAGGTLFLFVAFFGVTSAKAVVFYPFLIIGLYLGVRTKLLPILLSGGVLALIALPWAIFQSVGSNFFSSTILLRVFSVPAFDSIRYYEYFQGGEKMYLRNTLLGTPFRTFESDQIALVIGQDTWGYGSEVFANVGVFATGYMHFGWFGMIIFPVLVGVTLKLLDKVALDRIPNEIAIPLTAVAGVQFLSSDFTTTLLTHGLLLTFVCALLIGKKSNQGQAGAAQPLTVNVAA